MGITSVIGIAVTWYAGAHIRITFLREKRGPRARAGLDALGALMFLGWTTAMAFGNVGGGPGRRLSGEVLDGVVHT